MKIGGMRSSGSRRFVVAACGAAFMLAGHVDPLAAAERKYLVILANSPKQFPGAGQPPEGLPPFSQINNQYFDKTPGNAIQSFAEYWEEISYGDVTISGQTTDWLVLPWSIQPPANNSPAQYLNMNTTDGSLFRYGTSERFHSFEAMHNVDRDGNPDNIDNGPFNQNRQPGGSDSVTGGDGFVRPVWMPGQRFLDMDGDSRWDGLDEATNQMDWLPMPNGDGIADLLGPWIDLDGNGEPNNPGEDCLYLQDSNNDFVPDCCPLGPGRGGCQVFVDTDGSPATAPVVNIMNCPPTTAASDGGESPDCNGNLVPDPCDIDCDSAECLATGFDTSLVASDGQLVCGRSLDSLPLTPTGGTPSTCTQGTPDGTPDECQFDFAIGFTGPTQSRKVCWNNGVPTAMACPTSIHGTRGQCPSGQICHWIGCAQTIDLMNPGACETLGLTACVDLPAQHPAFNPEQRCEFHDINGNNQCDIVEPFESFLRIGDHLRRDQFDNPDPGMVVDGSTPEGAQYIMDNYPGDAQKIIQQSLPRDLFGMIDPLGRVPAGQAAQLLCPDGTPPFTMSPFPRPVCKTGEHIAYTSPDRWFDRGSTKVRFDKIPIPKATLEPSWYQQAWRDRYNVGGCGPGACDPPPWDDTVEFSKPFPANERRFFSANRGGLFGNGAGWVPAANISVVFTTDSFEESVDRRILPEEVNGIGSTLLTFDGYVEHDDLPSSKYHVAGDKRFGEVTSPYNNDPWGDDIRPVNGGGDGDIDAGGPYATKTHGDLNTDAGNVQNMELRTWRTGVDWPSRTFINPPPSFNNGVAWEGQYGSGLHPFVGPSGANLGFRDFNLDGMLDQGEVPPAGSENYIADTDPQLGLIPGTATIYPWNRQRLLEDCIEVLDQIFDFNSYVDQVAQARVGAQVANKPSQFRTVPVDPVTSNGVLSGIVLLSAGSHDPGDFLRAPSFFPIHNEDNNDPADAFPNSNFGNQRINWNLFVHDLVIETDDNRSATAFQSGYSAHEYLHTWEGFPDLYDYDIYKPFPQPPINTPIGQWDIMAGSGQVPINLVHPLPILKEKPGTDWIKPVDLTTVLTPGVDSTITLPRSEFVRDNSHYYIENEDFLGERFYFWNVGAGFNQFLPGSGMLVLHTNVGANPNALPSGQQNATNFDFLIVQADGAHQLESGITPFGDAGDPFPGTSNRRTFDCGTNPSSTWYNPTGQCTGLSVRDVVPDGAGNIAVTFNWLPTNIPSVNFIDPPGGTSVTVSPTIERYKVTFDSTDVFGGTTIKLYYINEDTNDLAKLKTAIGANLIGTLNKLTPGRLQLSMDWNVKPIADGTYYVFAELIPGPGTGGTERRFTNPRAGRNNKGNGTVNNVVVDIAGQNARLETWSLVCTKAATTNPAAPSEWAVTSSLTQIAPANNADQKAIAGTQYASRNNAVRFQINDGTTPYVVGDTFAFVTTGLTAISEPVTVSGGAITENPIARIIASPLAGNSPLTVNFDARTSTDPSGQQNLTYAWNFGDNTTGNGAQVTHTFTGAQTFTVVLTVTNTVSGRSGSSSVDIALTNNSPTAVISAAPTSGAQAFTTNFSAASSSDAETPANQLIYRWDFGDGTSVSTGVPGQSISVSKFYAPINNQPTTYTATLTVTDPGGKSGTAAVTILVGNSLPTPVVSFTALSGLDPLTVEFNAISSTDADGDAINVTWKWGDGTPDETYPRTGKPPATNGAVPHTFRLAAADTTKTFNVTAELTDARGGKATWPGVQVTVNKPGPGSSNPRAIFSINPDPPVINEPFTADGSLSFDRPTSGPVSAYSWNWGDGTALSTGARPTHTYARAGTFTITLTVSDAETPPNTGTATKTVAVASGGSGGNENKAPTAAFTAAPGQGEVATVFAFDATPSTDPEDDPLTYRWTFGDGATGDGVQVNHQYAGPGNYIVRLTVRDDSNASSDTARTIVVTGEAGNRAPVASIGTGPRSGPTPLTLTFNGQNSFDPDSDDLSFTWEFRQGETLIGSQTGEIVTRRFDAIGSYTVELVVSDGELEDRTDRQTITVTEVIPDDGGSGQPLPDPDEPAPLPVRPSTVCGIGMMMSLFWSVLGLTGLLISRGRVVRFRR